MRIPFLDLTRQHDEVAAEAGAALTRAAAAGAYILGPQVAAFEAEWARFCGVAGAAGVNNGTDALALALTATGAVRPGRGDEVVTSPVTAGYTGLAILRAGGVPVFADVEPRSATLDPGALARALTPRTRAVVPVHLHGQMADMAGICEVAGRHGLLVLEDAAQAHGAVLDGRAAGGHGHAAAFSFYPTKNLGAWGDAGAVTSNDASVIARVRELREGAHPAAMLGDAVGANSRLDELQAAVLRVKLARLAEWNARRAQLAGAYRERLGAACVPGLELPTERAPGAHAFHLYVVRHAQRDRLQAHLGDRGVETLVHYRPLLHQQPLFYRAGQRALPVAERLAGEMLSLPLYPQLRPDELGGVVEAVAGFAPAR
ncbi:MAG TPA: DegT/DnrJ/EryC1/StrS family aminotransferase [Longimicrobium sp.]|jgi:dTDP-3-amino-3,4,6-trideoxy-alpha-D-glucose transaminase|uniref:DegT/DnrJ/EryC1/StrS family aminotransferase n=1 Tax=Longimicrobium sp. TaxID=2029185 RepID=UPI002EDA21C2